MLQTGNNGNNGNNGSTLKLCYRCYQCYRPEYRGAVAKRKKLGRGNRVTGEWLGILL